MYWLDKDHTAYSAFHMCNDSLNALLTCGRNVITVRLAGS
jgi:hypothetical protein